MFLFIYFVTAKNHTGDDLRPALSEDAPWHGMAKDFISDQVFFTPISMSLEFLLWWALACRSLPYNDATSVSAGP